MVRIAQVEADSIADELCLEIGTRIVRINGQRVRDGIDLTLLLADSSLELETVAPDGDTVFYEIEREPGEPVGIVPVPDKVRECGNKCVFCFIDGNPKDARDALWLRDDDFRLSFTYGSYVTLTNLGPRGMRRLVEQRISPLYVSVHATEPEVRERLLVNRRAGLIMEQLRYLLDNGLEVHAQVVICPEWNDGAHLDRTISDLYGLGEGVRSLSIVPVGLTKYNLGRPVRLLTRSEALDAITQVDRIRERALAERASGWCYAADEMYLIAGSGFPDDGYYDEGSLCENGVGAVNRFVRRFDEGLPHVPAFPGRTLRIVTGRSMEELWGERAPLLAGATGAEVEVVAVPNDYYGETVTVAGLLAGRDIVRALGETVEDDFVLLPAEALNADDLFVDSVPLGEVREAVAPAAAVAGYDLLDCLRRIAASPRG